MSEEQTPKHLQDEKAKANQFAQFYEDSVRHLKENPEFIEFSKQYNEKSVEEFVKDYANQRAMWLRYGPFQLKALEAERIQWVNDAFECLKEIQQKKLFDLQCLWRAEKIELPGVNITEYFTYWEDHILQCPFLEPVIEEEVDLYLQYLDSNNYEKEVGWGERWQDYEEIKEAYLGDNEVRNFPEWYDFYNGRKGTGVYMTLPDIRGPKEMAYRQLTIERNEKQMEEQQKATPPPPNPNADTRPPLHHYKRGIITWFVDTFEDKETQQMFADYGGENPWEESDELLQDLISKLSEHGEVWPIQGWFDIREAMQRCYKSYVTHKIKQAMPEAYEEYKLQIETGLGFADDNPLYNWDVIDIVEKQILDGREINGEPRDFNF